MNGLSIKGMLGALLLAVSGVVQGNVAVPEHFSARAKELLADSIELAPAAHAVNVVYFLGNDNEPEPDYERRLSELLLYVQQFYGKEMQRNGMGARSFGLRREANGNVRILLVRGKKSHRDYPYNGGTNACLQEVAEFFRSHPEEKHSDHTFILMPTFHDEQNGEKSPGGVPFYGYGRDCFALDYADFDIKHLGQNTREGRLLTKWLGGFAHELGHGLNLPHNAGTTSDVALYGTPLMGAGNYTFGMRPTYMTRSSCRLLTASETFALAGDETDFYPKGAPAPVIEAASVVPSADKLVVRMRVSGCAFVNLQVQDPPFQVNRDYDAVAFCMAEEKLPGTDSVVYSLEVPLAELQGLQNTRKGEQALEVLLTQANGWRYRWRITLDWSKLTLDAPLPLPETGPLYRGY